MGCAKCYTTPMREKIFGVRRNVFFLGLVSFFNDLSNEMILSIFPAFFTGVLKAGAASLGIVEGIADGAANLIKFYSGRLADRMGKRKVLAVSGYTLSVAVRPFYLLASTVGGVLGLRVADRIGKGIRESPRDALLSLSTATKDIGRSFGFHRAMDTLGAIGGPLLAFIILRKIPDGFNAVFLTAFLVGLLAIVSFVFVRDVKNGLPVKTGNGFSGPLSPVLRKFLVAEFFLSLGTLPTALLLIRPTELDFSLDYIPLFYLFYSTTSALFSTAAGKAADVIGFRPVLMAGYLFLIGGYVLLNAAAAETGLIIAFAVLGLFAALSDGVGRSFVGALAPRDSRGRAYGAFHAVAGFGALASGVVGGIIWNTAGAGLALAAAGSAAILGILLLSRVRDR